MWGRICKKEKKEKEKNHHLCPCFETTSKSGVVSCDSGCYGCISAGEKQEENGKNNLLAIQGSGPCLPFRHFPPSSLLISSALTITDFSLHHGHSQQSLLSGFWSQRFLLSRRLFFQSFMWHSTSLYSALYSNITLSVVFFQINYLI